MPEDEVVLVRIPAGTYHIASAGILRIQRSNIIIRGDGSAATLIDVDLSLGEMINSPAGHYLNQGILCPGADPSCDFRLTKSDNTFADLWTAFFGDPVKKNSPFSSSGGWIWARPRNPRGPEDIGGITSVNTRQKFFDSIDTPRPVQDGFRGDHDFAVVGGTSGYGVGDRLRLMWYADEGFSSPFLIGLLGGDLMQVLKDAWCTRYGALSDGCLAYGSRLETIQTFPNVAQIVTIERIEGNRVYVKEPLANDLSAGQPNYVTQSYVRTVPGEAPFETGQLEHIGLEGFSIRFPTRTTPPEHHKATGFNGIYLVGVAHSWVTDVKIENPDNGIVISESANVTLDGIETAGVGAHFGILSSESDRILATHVLAEATWTDHILSFANFTKDSVYTSSYIVEEYGPDPANDTGHKHVFDMHRGLDGPNLIENTIVEWRNKPAVNAINIFASSGRVEGGPKHVAYTTYWNVGVLFREPVGQPTRLGGVLEAPNARLHALWARDQAGSLLTLAPITYNPLSQQDAMGFEDTTVPSLFADQLNRRLRTYVQDAGTEGILSMEAENYATHVPGDAHSWVGNAATGASGAATMQIQPDINAGDANRARLEFRAEFKQTGTHYVWVRAWAQDGGSDSIHVGLNGVLPGTADRLQVTPHSTWTWAKATMSGTDATLDIPTAGEHRVSLVMREDGLIVDKVVLTTSGSFVPTGNGPPESPSTDQQCTPDPCSDAFQQDNGINGIVSIETEHHTLNVTGQTHSWDVNSTTGASGGSAMKVAPDLGQPDNSPPRLDFPVHFVKTGTHYVWVRGWAPDAGGNSVNAGFDGGLLGTSDRIVFPHYGTWTWSKATMDGVDATIHVATAGEHTINLWMREDGFIADKIVLTTNPAYVPTSTGPPESDHGEPPPMGPFEQDAGAQGIVSVEAESYDLIEPGTVHDWVADATSGASGLGAMKASPDAAQGATISPRLAFEINFVKTGTHYVWVRGWAPDGGGNSVHTGFDGSLLGSSDRMSAILLGAWTWFQTTMDGPVSTINVPITGLHTLDVWMREDGFIVDKVVLTTDSNYVPIGLGPAESPRF